MAETKTGYNLFENKDKFQNAIGGFLIKFAELEFSLLYYCGLIDNPKNQTISIREYIGTELEKRRNKISKFIHLNLPELSTTWDKINTNLSVVNSERRFLIHGIGRTSFYLDSIKAVIKQKGELKSKYFSIDDINKLTNQIAHLLTGDNGLTGEFLVEFSTKRFNLYNSLSDGDDKIIYKINDVILTEFKGLL
jgi:hypothetical protein